MYNQRNKTVCSPLLHMRALRSFYFSFSASGDLCPQYNSKADTRLPNTVTSPRFSRTNDLVGLQIYQLLCLHCLNRRKQVLKISSASGKYWNQVDILLSCVRDLVRWPSSLWRLLADWRSSLRSHTVLQKFTQEKNVNQSHKRRIISKIKAIAKDVH